MVVKASRIQYVSDRGHEFFVDAMEPSHLLNAINHHRTQLETCKSILARKSSNFLLTRMRELEQTIDTLENELLKRDPAKDYGELDTFNRYEDEGFDF